MNKEERIKEIGRCNRGIECAEWHGICPIMLRKRLVEKERYLLRKLFFDEAGKLGIENYTKARRKLEEIRHDLITLSQ